MVENLGIRYHYEDPQRGIKKNIPVWRAEEVKVGNTKTFSPTPFQVFGCKVIASRHRFSDEALESRCITIELRSKIVPYHIPEQLPPEAFTKAQSLRNKLLGWRFKVWREIEIPKYPREFVMEGRFKELFLPFYSLFGHEVLDLARLHREGMKAYLNTSEKADVIVAIDVLDQRNSRIYMGDIAEEAGIDPQTAGKLVRELGFEKKRDRHGSYLVESNELLGGLATDFYLSPKVEA